MQTYSDLTRRDDPYALPDIDVFFVSDQTIGSDRLASHAAGITPYWEGHKVGYYWWYRCPGYLPDSEPIGPFASAEAAEQDAQTY